MRDTRREVPDNSHINDNASNTNSNTPLRPHLAPSAPSSSHLGNLGPFGQARVQMLPAGAPQGSVAYAQASGSVDAAPPPPDKHKDKRTKVSRACDECRRKKIRCDAIDETGSVPCTNCARYVRSLDVTGTMLDHYPFTAANTRPYTERALDVRLAVSL